jgi:hypothetical protein
LTGNARRGQTVVIRADAAFALPALYEALERRGLRYAIRLPANDVLERAIEDLLTRPRGRPSYARRFTLQLAESHLTRPLLGASLATRAGVSLGRGGSGGEPSERG